MTTFTPNKPKSSAPYVFDIYPEGKEWRWRLWSRNGKIVANGGESFKSLSRLRAFCAKLVPGAAIVVCQPCKVMT